MSRSRLSSSVLSCNTSPLKVKNIETCSTQTQASTEDLTSSFENVSERNIDSPTNEHFPPENVSIKLQLLARAGISSSRISLLSSCLDRLSFSQSINPLSEETKPRDSLLLDKGAIQSLKVDLEKENEKRVHGEFRSKYLTNLRHMNILDSKTRKKHQSIMLIDWDGALFGGIDIEEVKNNQKFIKSESTLKVLDETASKLLTKAAENCSVFIVTSYDEDLVDHNSSLYLPLTYQVMKRHNMHVISLQRDHEETETSSESQSQEIKGLMDIRKKLGDDVRSNIICVVDSETKIDIIQKLTNTFEGALVKFLRFKECVKVSQLIKQQELLVKEFENIFFSLRSFTMQFAKNQGKK